MDTADDKSRQITAVYREIITPEVTDDPVRGSDGYTYERKAITEWTLDAGVSPFTGQTLRIDELEAKCGSQFSGEQGQNEQPSEESKTMIENNATHIMTVLSDNEYEEVQPTKKNSKACLACIIITIEIVVILPSVFVIGFCIIRSTCYPTGM